MSKLKGPDGRIPDRLPDGRPAVAWERRWTEGTLPLWLVATAGRIAVIFVLGIFFYGSYTGVGSAWYIKNQLQYESVNILTFAFVFSGALFFSVIKPS